MKKTLRIIIGTLMFWFGTSAVMAVFHLHQHRWADGVQDVVEVKRATAQLDIGLACGRYYLAVDGFVVAMQGDICRDTGRAWSKEMLYRVAYRIRFPLGWAKVILEKAMLLVIGEEYNRRSYVEMLDDYTVVMRNVATDKLVGHWLNFDEFWSTQASLIEMEGEWFHERERA